VDISRKLVMDLILAHEWYIPPGRDEGSVIENQLRFDGIRAYRLKEEDTIPL